MSERILVVDDETQMALAMERVLRRRGYEVDTAHDGRQALAALARRRYPVVVSDLRMPEIDGVELLKRIRLLAPATQVILATAFGTVASAVACVRDGARNYLVKPFAPEALIEAVEEALKASASAGTAADDIELVAEDASTQAVVELARRAALSEVTVLLEAESGAGKEIVARLIHGSGPRASGPFVAVNCAALPRELLEAELFGHVRGAFTGALRDRKGHFEAAASGTLLLDEVGEMSTDLQARLLRVLQDHVVQPIGSETPVKVDVRVIAATNRNLREEVAEGRFREDLFYRLHVLPIRIPPLRERPLDLDALASRFARRHAGKDVELTAAARAALRSHSWPGNVRELDNAMQRAAILARGGPIDAPHLALEPGPKAAATTDSRSASLDDAEREAVGAALRQSRGNRIEAAATLGISPRTLRHKLKMWRDAGYAVAERAR